VIARDREIGKTKTHLPQISQMSADSGENQKPLTTKDTKEHKRREMIAIIGDIEREHDAGGLPIPSVVL
jgi:hypothetical protein